MNEFDIFAFARNRGMENEARERAGMTDISQEQYQLLKEEVAEYGRLYYDLDQTVISDYEYDMKVRQLKKMEQDHPEWVKPDSPTQIVGSVPRRTAGDSITHNVPMLSIQDVFSHQEVAQWMEDVYESFPSSDVSVEEKIDGLSMTVRYQGGKLVMAETRGDGYVGENVTANAMFIDGIPKTIRASSDDDYLEVRGEVYMTYANLERYNHNQEMLGKPLAANARNLAAGTLRQLDASIVQERGLSFFAFSVQDAKGAYADLMSSQGYGMEELRALGFTPVSNYICNSVDAVLDAIEKIGARRSSLPYGIDGAVVKISLLSRQKLFPTAAKYAPGHIAYKYPPEEKDAVISDIEVGVGRTGKLSFTAVLEKPVLLAGTSVQRSTVHNKDFIQMMGIGIGARVVVRKQGDIIPAIVRVYEEPSVPVYQPPVKCPVCGQPLEVQDGIADIYCVNPNCLAQLKNMLIHFCSREALDIKALGENSICALVERGYLQSYADLYDLKDHRLDLIEQGILGRDKNTDKVLSAIEQSKQHDAYRFLTAIGIRNVGQVTAKNLLQHFGTIENLMTARQSDLLSVADIGETTALSLIRYFSVRENKELLARAKAAGVNFSSIQAEKAGILTGKSICITGTLSKPREQIAALVENHGGKVVGSVSRKTDYLLAGEAAGSKLKKAKELGTVILTEVDFEQLLSK